MQPATTQPASLDGTASPSRNKKRRTSEQSSDSTAEQQESANMLAPMQLMPVMPTMSGPGRASSGALSPPGGEEPVRLTRTGRPSRASKGQRVHQCEECGKIYTRAEHLRRHQQNHKPGAFPCDIPGCSRSFYREDLLFRHKARQHDLPNAESPHAPVANRDSASIPARNTPIILPLPTDAQSTPGGVDGQTTLTRPLPPRHPSNDSEQHSSGPESRKARPDNLNYRSCTQPVLTVGGIGNGWESVEVSDQHSDSSSVYSPLPIPYSIQDTPYSPHLPAQRHGFDASFWHCYPGIYTSHPSSSPEISFAYPATYGENSEPSVSFGPGCLSAYTTAYDQFSDPTVCNDGMTDSRLLPELRDTDEQVDFVIPNDSPKMSPFLTSLDNPTSFERQYVQAYWNTVHPIFPIVHQPSFDCSSASPLLKAAMLALGASAYGDLNGKNYAMLLHERCNKVLHKRTINESHSFRVCDMQAVILVEIFSIFKCRRPAAHVSKQFEKVYNLLVDGPAACERSGFSVLYPHSVQSHSFSESEQSANNSSYEHDLECKQRLLVACYILDQQHALLLGRARVRHLTDLAAVLTYPRSQREWDITEQATSEVPFLSSSWPIRNHSVTPDNFQAMYSIALSIDSDTPGSRSTDPTFGAVDECQFSHLLRDKPSTQLAYNTLLLCKTTPMRDLLAVAGESWVLSEKLNNPIDLTAAQLALLEWARARNEPTFQYPLATDEHCSVRLAVHHALQILRLHHDDVGDGGTLFDEWALYLAALVLWASAYIDSSGAARGKTAAGKPISIPAACSAKELERTVSSVLRAGPSSRIGLHAAMRILAWARDRIQPGQHPYHCGLVSGAVDVLAKLAARGSDAGWFG